MDHLIFETQKCKIPKKQSPIKKKKKKQQLSPLPRVFKI